MFIWQKLLHLLTVSCATELAVTQALTAQTYHNVPNGLLCISSSFTEIMHSDQATNKILCASACSKKPRCQAFSTADGPCQLFVFDACSKSVRNCSCSRRGQVFVKQQLGLQPGALCPSGYGDDLCGVKYKLYTNKQTWQQGRQKCQSDGGLVIMADVVDAAEMAQVDLLYSKYSSGLDFWLGGFQAPGGQEPASGWSWVACGLPVDSGLWGTGQPDNSDNLRENAIGRWKLQQKLADIRDSQTLGLLCECSSPFD